MASGIQPANKQRIHKIDKTRHAREEGQPCTWKCTCAVLVWQSRIKSGCPTRHKADPERKKSPSAEEERKA
jgi:hypothetical protein